MCSEKQCFVKVGLLKQYSVNWKGEETGKEGNFREFNKVNQELKRGPNQGLDIIIRGKE